MRPATYGPLVELLATRCRVVVPDLFAVRGRWRYAKVLEAFTASLDHLGLDRVSLLGHSFGGGIELGFAARWPQRTVELVFSDTLAVSRQFRLADEAMRHPGRLVRLATPAAASAFVENWVRHPRQLVGAAWWGFSSGRDTDSALVGRDGIPAHVLWANRDSILSRSDGQAFARELHLHGGVGSRREGDGPRLDVPTARRVLRPTRRTRTEGAVGGRRHRRVVRRSGTGRVMPPERWPLPGWRRRSSGRRRRRSPPSIGEESGGRRRWLGAAHRPGTGGDHGERLRRGHRRGGDDQRGRGRLVGPARKV